jgi:hypothetical protein
MALTEFEKTVARRMLASWSGRIPVGGELDDVKYQEFMEGDEASRRLLIKAYITDVLLPFEQETKANHLAAAQDANQKITIFNTYLGI